MKRNRAIVLLASAVALLSLLGCDAIPLISSLRSTATPTRTPRPTFTRRPEFTPTPEDTPTPALTDTPITSPLPIASPTATRRVATARPTTPKPPPPPPPPQFPVTMINNYSCGQGSEVWEIIGSVRRSTSPSIFLGNYVLGLFSSDGRLLKASDPSYPDGQQVMALDISCQQSKQFPYNIKIDATDFRGKGGFFVRIIKSQGDATPLSDNVPVDFTQPVRWFVFFNAAQ